MRTRPSFAKSQPALLTVLMLLGSSATVSAARHHKPKAEAQPATAAPVAPAVVAPVAVAPAVAAPPAAVPPVVAPPVVAVPAPPVVVAAPPAPAPTPAPVVVEPIVAPVVVTTAPVVTREPVDVKPSVVEPPVPAEPTSVTEVGVQRLPGSAYPEPQTRGLKHGSLWLTFHGMQWPYMPTFGKNERFVVGVSGWGWVDTAYEKFGPWGANPSIDQSRIKYWKQQSRMLLRITPTYALEDNWFIQGQAEIVATGDQTISRSDVGAADTDDLWLRVGKWNQWDVQVGRYEGWEVFHLGMGLDQNTFERKGAVGIGESSYNIQFYGLTDNQFRPSGPAGNLAFHYYPLPYLRFELLGMAGSLASPVYGTRPVAVLDLGWVKFKIGTEFQRLVAQQVQDQTHVTSKGVGGAIQFVFEPHIEFGLNAAQGTVWSIDSTGKLDAKGSLTRTSFGGFANVSNGNPHHTLIFGVGSIFTRNVDQNDVLLNGVVDNYWHYQGFMAAQYVIRNQFYIKLVGGYARAHFLTAGNDPPLVFDDEMYSARVRFSYYF